MARAETTESVGEPAGAGGASLAHLSTCCMELPHSFHSWPGLLTNANAPGGTIHLPRRHHQHHSRRPVQDLALPCPLPYLLPAGMEDAPQMHRPSSSRTPPSPPPQRWREEARDGCGATPSAYPGERFGGETTGHSRVAGLDRSVHGNDGLPHPDSEHSLQAHIAPPSPVTVVTLQPSGLLIRCGAEHWSVARRKDRVGQGFTEQVPT
ncbi:bcl-2-binding component 3 isoform X2 [Lampris incognitus]|uniref:bcl-2-binding component 3 isoform X2 n=1 Tax=Lampris incognitus TaxID=2546036 RepID=UPI0024B5FF98|nr:bcl-2-binding component 3 isoform X2 [Lampris incognitus]